MATNYKILGQGVNSLKIDAPENGSTIISELKIKNTSYPIGVDVMCGETIDEEYFVNTKGSINSQSYPSLSSVSVFSDNSVLFKFSSVSRSSYDSDNPLLYKYNKYGVLDRSFIHPTLEFSSTQYGIQFVKVLSSDRILIADDRLTSVNGVSVNKVAILNSDGTLDQSFSFPSIFFYRVADVIEMADNRILFAFHNADYSSIVVRLDSSGNNYTSGGITTNSHDSINGLALDNNGKILVYGSFSSYNDKDYNTYERRAIARLNEDLSFDQAFNFDNVFSTGSNYPAATIYSASVNSNDKILVSGTIWDFKHSAILNNDGTLDTSYTATAIPAPTDFNTPLSSTFLSNGNILLGGNSVLLVNSSGDTIIDSWNYDNYPSSNINSFAIDNEENFYILGFPEGIVDGITLGIAGLLKISKKNVSDASEYLIKNKEISFDEEIKISGGIAISSGESLAIDTRMYYPSGDDVIIQAYGIEETS